MTPQFARILEYIFSFNYIYSIIRWEKSITVCTDSPKEQQNLDVPHKKKKQLTTIFLREGWILVMNFFILILLSNLNVQGYQKIYTALPFRNLACESGKMPPQQCVYTHEMQVSHTCYFRVALTVRYLTICTITLCSNILI